MLPTKYLVLKLLVPSTSMKEAITAFECTWMSELWPPGSVQGDQAFNNVEFTDYLRLNATQFRAVHPRRHSKNVLESKHRILRHTYLRLKSEEATSDPRKLGF